MFFLLKIDNYKETGRHRQTLTPKKRPPSHPAIQGYNPGPTHQLCLSFEFLAEDLFGSALLLLLLCDDRATQPGDTHTSARLTYEKIRLGS